MTIWRKLIWLLCAFVLAGTGVIGVKDALGEWAGDVTIAQKSVTVAVGAYGVLGLIAAVGLMMRRGWSAPVAAAWGIAVVYAGTMAVIAFGGGEANLIGVLFAFLGTVLVSALVLWGVRRSVADLPGNSPSSRRLQP